MRASTYETDFFQWTKDQASMLRVKKFEDVDIENLIEEIETLGRTEKRALISHLRILLQHMLKMHYQPMLKTKSWEITIRNSKKEFMERLEENPSLKPDLTEILHATYKGAVRDACLETFMDEREFPKECPWPIEEILKSDE